MLRLADHLDPGHPPNPGPGSPPPPTPPPLNPFEKSATAFFTQRSATLFQADRHAFYQWRRLGDVQRPAATLLRVVVKQLTTRPFRRTARAGRRSPSSADEAAWTHQLKRGTTPREPAALHL